ncbi:ShlB/FhaC/HecB family hemolysin secretion/activation protein [Variovorax dokdonensis]|uniref:ShlB/FhaC/HecB family hemolysin secretion/activation protein n=1 Tax=Variovorax dokdonensis TaxID=344883 RepID=A0ABT7NAD9_9BURK|nr:ShlB/FhaC/HecB family hemolysin secretion/activation protein [Variovorax dokdonensis]MDM0044910.1 ShlB/FhaC/HecB family hemolysin secretion/activation protein [Variovorax dokdonensis]
MNAHASPLTRALQIAGVASLCWAAALPQAQAQTQRIESTTLTPTQNPCTQCRREDDVLSQGSPGAPTQALPAAPTGPQASFRLNDVRLKGANALGADELRPALQPYIGRDVTLTDLQTMAGAITQIYRDRGYFLAQALVPVQKVEGGVVEISVIEGRLGQVNVNVAPDAPIKEERVRAFLQAIPVGGALDTQRYERAMLLLSDQPGLRVSSTLQEGAQPGTTDLTVDVVAARRWEFAVDADNHGTEETGRYRLGATARWLSPFGIGDNIDLRLIGADSSGMVFGRASYEAPIGSSGLRAGIGAAHVQYELGGDFVNLDAHGTADIVDASLNYPVIRSRRHNLFMRLGADMQDLSDHYDAVNFNPKKRVYGLGLGWAWELRDDLFGGGYWSSSGTLYHGKLDLRDQASEQFDQSAFGLGTEGSFDKLTFRFSRLQSMFPRHSLYLSLGGQMADKNLDASQKLSLGGARAVRAYPSGELLVDEGLLGTIEWRWSLNDEWTPFVFYDAARGKVSHDPLAIPGLDNTQSLRGAGLGVSWARPNNFLLNATLAWRAGTREAITDGGGHNPRLFVQFQKFF